MRELNLFSGAGGGLLGTKLLGWRHCGYVEYDDYCQRVVAQRIEDGILDEAPIFGDINAFISEGYADAYQGLVDVVTAGFPCQPFSVAGKQAGADDERNMWPQTIDVIRRVRPRFALLENVPGLLAHEYSQQIFRDLAESGYSARWRVLSAAECGAPHKRDRLWIVADARYTKSQRWIKNKECKKTSKITEHEMGDELASCGLQMADSECDAIRHESGGRHGQGRASETELKYNGWWETEPSVGRVADGIPNRVDRLKAIGNGQVPIVAATAWRLLI